MAEKLFQVVSNMPLTWQIFILSMFPITELRAAIPYGVAQGLSPYHVFALGVAGNALVAIPILFMLEPAIKIVSYVPLGKKIADKVIEKSRKKGEQLVKYGPLGLALFVCIPLPGTGVWTGSLIAYLLGFKTTVAIISLSSGAALAGIIVTMMSVGAVHTLGLTAEWLVGIIVVIFLLAFLVKLFKK